MAVIKKIKDSSGTTHDIIDTKNTAGAAPMKGDIFIVGAKMQAESSITYTNEKCYISSTDNCLYSNGEKVATLTDIANIKDVDTKTTAGTTNVPTNDGKALFYLIGTKNTGVPYAQTYVNNSVYVDVINGNILYVPQIIAGGNITTNNGIITASAFYESSDERLKTFTEDYNINLDDIKNIKTGKFYWNSDENQVINGGVSAQTVEKYFPELVRENENGIKSVNYDGLAVVAIAAIKKLTERIEELENIVYNK